MNSATTSRYSDQSVAAAQSVLGSEQVLAAAVGGWPGQWKAAAWLYAVPLLGLYLSRHGKQRAGGLPERFVIAVTHERVVALGMPTAQISTQIKATKELRSWRRAELSVTSAPAAMGLTIRFTPSGAEPFEVAVGDKVGAAEVMAALNG